MSTSKTRNVSFDYLRILAIFLIVMHHTYFTLKGRNTDHESFSYLCMMLLGSGGKVGVNLFALITGYFMWNKDWSAKRVLSFVFQTIVVAWIIVVLNLVFFDVHFSDIWSLMIPIFPIQGMPWWYLTAYFIVLLLSPFVNRLINSLDFKQSCWFVCVLLALTSILPFLHFQTLLVLPSSGTGASWLLVMYIVGTFLGRFKDRFKWSQSKIIALLGVTLLFQASLFCLILLQHKLGGIVERLVSLFGWGENMVWTDYNPLLLLISILLFALAMRFHVTKMPKILALVSQQTLLVYMFHVGSPMAWQIRGHIYKGYSAAMDWMTTIIIVLADSLFIWIIFTVISFVLAPLVNKTSDKATNVLVKILPENLK